MSGKTGENRENFADFHRRFLRHLSANNNVAELSKRFGALFENSDRVDFVLDLFDACEINVNYHNERKSDEVAMKLREQGNAMFKIKKVKEAWEFYTKSISFSEDNSVNLALAYANRSAVLFELNLHKQCLKDIERALANNYPEHLRSKLLVRRKNSKNIETEAFEEPHTAVPTVSRKNPKIQCAGDCVTIEENEAMGRHLVATRDIKIGEIVAVERPFALLLVNQVYNHCHDCINLCYNLIPCSGCTRALYCSESCRERAFESYHKYECPVLVALETFQLGKLKLLPLRIAFLAKDQYEEIDDFRRENGFYRSDRYKEIHNLIANTSKRPVPDLFERATAAALIYNLIKNHTIFFHETNTIFERRFKEILLLHMQTGPSNFHAITELALNTNGVFESEEIASGAFAFMSLLNHSCSPNVTRFCYGSVMVLRAIQTIKKGEQCFDNYGYHHAVMEKTERQKQLKSQYYFDCRCIACRDNWALYDSLPSVDDEEIDESLLSKLSAADVDAAGLVLQDSLEKLQDLEAAIPCRNFCQLQEVVKQCFAIFGSKRRIF